MKIATFPSPNPAHRRADLAVHAFGLCFILVAGAVLLGRANADLPAPLQAALAVYVAAALLSNLASWAYHFAPWHGQRMQLRRIDHAAIYPSISGTFTPLFVLAGTPWSLGLMALSWALTGLGVWAKLRGDQVKSRWSTASYLGLGALGLAALPDLMARAPGSLEFICAGAAAYVIGTIFYTRRTLPYRYAIWHLWVNIGAAAMLAGIWTALF